MNSPDPNYKGEDGEKKKALELVSGVSDLIDGPELAPHERFSKPHRPYPGLALLFGQ